MKILFFTDVHSGEDFSEYYIEGVKELGEKINFILDKGKSCDIFVCCGDLSFFGSGLKESMKILKESGKKILIIPGNHEDPNELKNLCNDNVVMLHKKHLTINGITFAGYGGGGFDEKDKNLEKWANDLKIKVQGKLVLFTHAPPYNTNLDELPLVGHRGSKSVRKAIEELKPTIFASGHFHETFLEEDSIGGSKLINPGDKGVIIKI